jgi:very-short-patch-repair endonuclease
MNKDKYLQIFNYLLEFSKLRSNPVRDIESSDQYSEKIWFADIPQCDIFDCIIFPNDSPDADYWLKISKPKEPKPPTFQKLSETLTDWIAKDSLIDEIGIPRLKESIIKRAKTIQLFDQPEVLIEFQDYLKNQWNDDLELYKKEFEVFQAEYNEFEIQSKTYKQFFSIYNKAQQFGEEFELVFGAGLLYFKENENTPQICRHILTSKAEITFNHSQKESFIKVSSSIENEIQIETDAILDLDNQFNIANIIAAEKEVEKFLKQEPIPDSLFANQINEAMQIFVDRIRDDGDWQSIDKKSKPKEIPKRPTVYFAPALLLRKRNTKNLAALFEKIIQNVTFADNAIDIPSINDIIGSSEINKSSEGVACSLDDGTIYFPKKYNDEQIQIIEKMRRSNKVLVQGPPGTGKSHTIANLICHLLANGKKVLVTAYTKRALDVLKNQLPEDFQNLTVNLLSGDSASIQDLNNSVNAINDKLASITDLSSYKGEIEKRVIKLSGIKEEKAYAKNEWLKIKEQSTRRQSLNQNYQGTLSEIAEKLEKESSNFSWFKDEYFTIDNIESIAEDIEKFNILARHYQNVDCTVFNYVIPKKENLLSLSELIDYRRIENDLLQKHHSQENYNPITCNDFQVLKKQLEKLLELFSKIEECRLPFKLSLINDYRNNLPFWMEKIARTNNLFAYLHPGTLRQFERNVVIRYPDDKSWIMLKNDAMTLLAYLNKGNRLNGAAFKLKKPFLPVNIKRLLYFVDKVQVCGNPCDSIAGFEAVLTDIKIKQDLEELKNIWEVPPSGKSIPYSEKADYFKKVKDGTESLINALGEANKVKTVIESISTVRIHNDESNTVKQLINEADYCDLQEQTTAYKEKIIEVYNYLSIQNNHRLANSIISAIENFDTQKYAQHLSEIDALNSEKEKYSNYKNLEENLHKHFPELVNEILQDSFDISNIPHINSAIYFKHAFAEITKLLEIDYESNIIARLTDFERQEERLISEIGSQKAWLSVLERLSDNSSLRQHLQAWVLAVSRIGTTGTGRRALRFQREAQQQMEKCKDSVPCWVMPLYKVAETIKPEQGMYDYVIIDEASQLGADAIFLLYISKNIIIVGDDKQTSPEYIGVNANVMTPHINRHLQNIPFANYYGTEFSFFDHAKLFCNGMTVLREHFRCMPEIIEFCNKWFYAPDGKGLYPLKQYSENRLQPLQPVYSQNGYIDGTGQNITNKVEAEGIADKIAELIKDQKYTDKSFGVITLQGNRQADLIDNLILKKIGEVEYNKRNIVCGNSASFQGDERDVMFLSLITAHNHNRTALTTTADERRFNVAVSRAKEQIWLFHSVKLEDLSNTNDLRYKLLNHFLNYQQQQTPLLTPVQRRLGAQPAPFDSWFEVDVFNDIITNNYKVIPQYEVAKGKYRIDLVILLSNGVKIAIECDGDKFHGAAQFENDLMRQKVLERCGWQFFRIRGAEYYSNRIKALEPLWALLSKNESQKQESPITNTHTSSIKKAENATDETKQHVKKKPPVSSTNYQSEQIDLFDKESQTAIVSSSEQQIPVENRTKKSTNLFSCSEFLVFTSMQNVYKIQNRGFTKKTQVKNKIEFEPGEKIVCFTGTNNYSGYLLVAFENGKAGKIFFSSYQTEQNRKKLKNAFSGESKLIFIEHIENDIDLIAVSNVVASNKNKIILFNTELIHPVDSRTSRGVQVMKLKDGSLMTTVKKLDEVKLLNDPEYYRKPRISAVGYYLKEGDEI